jgi:hypothetical protein
LTLPTRHRIAYYLLTVEQRTDDERWFMDVWRAGANYGFVKLDGWASRAAPTPHIMSEVEDCLINPFEGDVMQRWGVQSVLL